MFPRLIPNRGSLNPHQPNVPATLSLDYDTRYISVYSLHCTFLGRDVVAASAAGRQTASTVPAGTCRAVTFLFACLVRTRVSQASPPLPTTVEETSLALRLLSS
jgi:hypothetical protein